MKLTLGWLRELVDTELSAEEVASTLTGAGLEVGVVEPLGVGLEDMRIGRVRSVRRHPNADRLSLCEVEDGERVLSVVCGAPNVRADVFVALAPVGSKLPDGTVIRKAKLRGELSEGMLCSEAELGLGEGADGILLLDDPELEAGVGLTGALGLDDWLIEIDLTPNRPDCLGVLGVARELAALTGAALRVPAATLEESGAPAADSVAVEITAPDRCARYAGRVVRGVSVGPSPAWVQARLAAVGIRSISNVVDASNLALIELGHPLHAFDLARLEGAKIVVRGAGEGERFVALDGVERTLGPEDLVIADAARAVALAGIMGGQDSGVTEGTTDVLLESAWFDPSTVRRTSRRLGLSTEASFRFERGTDPVGLALALDRLAELVVQLAGGRVAPGVVDVVPRPHEPRPIAFRPGRVRDVLGAPIEDAESLRILGALGVEVRGEGESRDAIAPPWRPDLEREVDLIEEVARVWGYDRVPAERDDRGAVPGGAGEAGPLAPLAVRATDALAGEGYRQAVSLTFVPRELVQRFDFPDGRAEPVALVNPLSEEGAVLAPALLPNLVRLAAANLHHRATSVRLFEVARVFRKAGGKWPVKEIPSAAAVLAGQVGAGPYPATTRAADFYDLKGTLENLLERLEIKGVAFEPADGLHYLEPGRAAEIRLGDARVGELGQVRAELVESLDVEGELFAFELDLDALGEPGDPAYRSFGRHPVATRDLGLVVDEGVAAEAVRSRLADAKWIESVDLFDVYRGEGVPDGRKSLTYRLTLRHPERTLTEDEVAGSVERVREQLAAELGAALRA